MGIEGMINEKIKKYEKASIFKLTGTDIFVVEKKVVLDDLQQLKSSLPTQQDKVVVPEFVAEWIEHVKKLHWGIIDLFSPEASSHSVTPLVEEWLNKDNAELLARAWLDGYAVEKEPLFIMPVPCMRNTLHYCLKDNGEISFRQGNAYKFNQDQLDKYFPEIKGFAVQVEEESQ